MFQRFIFLLLLLCDFAIAPAQIIIEGISKQKTFELLTVDNPLEKNLRKLKDVKTDQDGRFFIELPATQQIRIIFKNKDFSQELSVYPQTRYILSLHQRLAIEEMVTDNDNLNKTLLIEENFTHLKDRYGRPGKSSNLYNKAVYEYFKQLLTTEQANESLAFITNSESFVNALASLKISDRKRFMELEPYFVDNIQFSFNGIKAVNWIYGLELNFKFFKVGKKMSFEEFMRQELAAITDSKLKDIIDLIMINMAMGRKFSAQGPLYARLEKLMVKHSSNFLGELSQSIYNLHTSTLIGSDLEEFMLKDLNGTELSTKDFRGKYLLIDLWATWCGPCIKAMKKLPALKTSLNNTLEILCLSTDHDTDKMKRFAKRLNYQELIFAYTNENERLRNYLNIRAIPLYFLIDPDGKILGKTVTDPNPLIEKYLRK
ncbi:MAG: TlpA disulfide reductase family protein [Bacteroidota bacterium]